MLSALRENLLYKLLALAFAIALHVYVVGQANPITTRTLLVPLTVQNLPPNLLWNDNTAPHVAVTVSGAADDLNRLSPSAVTAFVNAKNARAGKNPGLRVQASLSPDANGVSVSPGDVQPSALTMTLEAKSRRRLPIIVSAPAVAPPIGYGFGAAQIAPVNAMVEGTRIAVASVKQLTVQADTDATPGAVDDDLPIVALDASGGQVSDVTISPATAHIRISLARVPASKVLLVSPNLTGTPPYPYKVTDVQVSPASVTVTGRPDALANAATIATLPLDLSGMTADTVQQVACALPSGLKAMGDTTVTIAVKIAAMPAPEAPAPPLSTTPNPADVPPPAAQ